MVIDTTVPVVNIWRGGYGDVSIARTLGRLGVSMYLIAQTDLATPVWSSRYWSRKTRWDFARPEDHSVEHLLDVGAQLRAAHGVSPILLTTSDWLAIFIERNIDRLSERFTLPKPTRPVIHALMDKWKMQRLASENGIPTPQTAYPRSLAEGEEFASLTGFPIVMKPADPYVQNLTSKRIINSHKALSEELARATARAPLNVVLQEYIPGDADSVWMCNAYFSSDDRRTITFTGKKLRQTSSTGIASLAICLPNETVADQTRRLMEGAGFRGCTGIGFRYDGRDGLYKLLDVNARVSGIFRLFVGTDEMDVVRACYLDMTDQYVPATTLQPGRKWMLEDDLLAAFVAARHRQLTLAGWLESVRGVREVQWFAPDDPAPGLHWMRGKATAAMRRMTVSRA
jgi:D-aspartate ligase